MICSLAVLVSNVTLLMAVLALRDLRRRQEKLEAEVADLMRVLPDIGIVKAVAKGPTPEGTVVVMYSGEVEEEKGGSL